MSVNQYGWPVRPLEGVRLEDDEKIIHYADEMPTHDRHGRTMCGRLWDTGPCTNVLMKYVPKMTEVDFNTPATCFLCLAAEAGES